MQSWFIENPISKDLAKKLTVRLSPNAEKEFIIVMKAPSNRVKYNMASYLYIKSAAHSRRQNSTGDHFELEKHLKKRN